MSKINVGIALSGAVAVMCLGAAPAHAQALDDQVWLEVSAYWASVDSSIRVEPANATVPGTVIDFESDLKLKDSEALPALFAGFRPGGNWVIGAEYYSLSRSSSTNISREIVFDDVVFPVDVTVSGKFASDIYRVTVGYAFYRTEEAELGAAVGLHATDFEVRIAGEAQVGQGPAVRSVARRREALAPLPTLGLFGSVEIAPQVTLTGRVDYLSLKVGNYDGRLINTQAAVTYRVFENVGIGAAFRYVNYRLKVEKDDWQGELRYKFNGPALFLQAGF